MCEAFDLTVCLSSIYDSIRNAFTSFQYSRPLPQHTDAICEKLRLITDHCWMKWSTVCRFDTARNSFLNEYTYEHNSHRHTPLLLNDEYVWQSDVRRTQEREWENLFTLLTVVEQSLCISRALCAQSSTRLLAENKRIIILRVIFFSNSISIKYFFELN